MQMQQQGMNEGQYLSQLGMQSGAESMMPQGEEPGMEALSGLDAGGLQDLLGQQLQEEEIPTPAI